MQHRSIAAFDRFPAILTAIPYKAEAHCRVRRIKPEVMLTARLFPDRLPFTRQVHFTCHLAARGTVCLAGQALPTAFPETGPRLAGRPGRIDAARGHMGSIQDADLVHADTREVQFGAEVRHGAETGRIPLLKLPAAVLLPPRHRLRHPAPQRRRP